MNKNIVNGEAATIVVFLNGPSYVRDFHLIKSHKPYGFTKKTVPQLMALGPRWRKPES